MGRWESGSLWTAAACCRFSPVLHPLQAGKIHHRGAGIGGTFTLLNPSDPVSSLTWTDTGSAVGVLYQVRACRLQVTGGGSYWNTSQGVFQEAP
jgi:hypothetical protein